MNEMDRAHLYYDVACTRTQDQDKQRRHLDTMAAAFLSLSGVLVGVMAFTASYWSWWSVYPAVVVMLGFAGVAISTIIGLWLRRWEFQPPLDELYKHMESGEYEDEALVIWTAKWMADAVANNSKGPLRRKTVWLRLAYVCFAVEATALWVCVLSTVV